MSIALSSTSSFASTLVREAHHDVESSTSQVVCEVECCSGCDTECGTSCVLSCETDQSIDTTLTAKKKLHSHITLFPKLSLPIFGIDSMYFYELQAYKKYISWHSIPIYKPKFQTYSDLVGIVLLTV